MTTKQIIMFSIILVTTLRHPPPPLPDTPPTNMKTIQFATEEEVMYQCWNTRWKSLTYRPRRHSLFAWCIVNICMYVELVSRHESDRSLFKAIEYFILNIFQLIIWQQFTNNSVLFMMSDQLVDCNSCFAYAKIKITKPKDTIKSICYILYKKEKWLT